MWVCWRRTGAIARRGFTLVETLAVVIILACLAAMLIPAMGSQNDLRTKAAARTVLADLAYAQNLAIARQAMVYVKFGIGGGGSGGGYQLFSDALCSVPIIDPLNNAGFAVNYGTGPFASVCLTETNFNGPANQVLAFDELGVPYAYPSGGPATQLSAVGNISLSAGVTTVQISIDPDSGAASTP